MTSRRRALVDHLLLLAPIALVLAPLFIGRVPLPDYLRWFAPWYDPGAVETVWNPLWYDAVGQYWPWRTLLAEGLRDNQLPLWNPYVFTGYAFVGTGQSALYYPPNWLLFGLLPVPFAFSATAVLHLWLAAAGAYRLVREVDGSRAAALLAGVTFSLSGFLITWLMLPTLVSSGAWLPWALAGLERARRSGRWLPALAAGGCVGLSALAGHPQIFYYVAVTTALVGALRLPPRQWGRLAAALALGGLLAAPSVLPLLELAPRSHRPPSTSAEGYAGFLSRSIPADHLITLMLPDYFGDPSVGTADPRNPQALLQGIARGEYWGADARGVIAPGDYTEFNICAGLLPLLLLLYALAWGSPAARVYGGVALLALVLAFGPPFSRLLYFWLPGYSGGAGPCRLAVVWCCAAAVAAGLGLDAVRRDAAARRVGRAAAGVVVVLAVAWLLARAGVASRGPGAEVLLDAAGFQHLLGLLRAVLLLGLGAAVVIRRPALSPLVVALDLAWFGWGFNPAAPPDLFDPRPPLIEAVAAELAPTHGRLVALDPPRAWGFYQPPLGLILPPNLATAAGVRDEGGYDSLLPAAQKQAMAEAARGGPPAPLINGNMLLLGEVGPDLTEPAVVLALAARPLGEGWLPTELPYAWRRADASPQPRLSSGADTAVAFGLDGVNRVALSGSGAGTVLLRDAADPGWRLYRMTGLGAAPWPWQPSGRFRRTQAPGGLWSLRYVYQPIALRAGLFAALWALAVLAGLTGFGVRRANSAGASERSGL